MAGEIVCVLFFFPHGVVCSSELLLQNGGAHSLEAEDIYSWQVPTKVLFWKMASAEGSHTLSYASQSNDWSIWTLKTVSLISEEPYKLQSPMLWDICYSCFSVTPPFAQSYLPHSLTGVSPSPQSTFQVTCTKTSIPESLFLREYSPKQCTCTCETEWVKK